MTNKSINEKTPFNPVSPYGVAKLYSDEIIKTQTIIIFSHLMEFFLIMKVQEEVRHLLEKLQLV